MASTSSQSLHWILNHVVLPSKLPQVAEERPVSHPAECDLVRILESVVSTYRRHGATELSDSCKTWAVVENMFDSCSRVIASPSFSVDTLRPILQGMKVSRKLASLNTVAVTDIGCAEVLLLLIGAQNAVLVLRKSAESVIFECFEASPLTESVMATKGRLIRHFPAHAVSIPTSTFNDHNFQHELVHRLVG